MLVAYVTACSMERIAAEALEREGLVVGARANPWLVVQEKQVRAMVSLSLRLRLCPHARTDPKSTGRSAGAGPRGVEALFGGGHDED